MVGETARPQESDMQQDSSIRLHVADGHGDPDRAADLAWQLRSELLEYDVERVDHAPGAPPPPGAKGAAMEWAQLIVSFAGSMPPLLGAVQQWLGRQHDCDVEIEFEGERLALKGVSDAERDLIVSTWLRKRGIE
jgi:Effector Associated Constant Component 1